MLKRKNWSIGGKQNNNCAVTRSLLWSSSRPDFSPDEEKQNNKKQKILRALPFFFNVFLVHFRCSLFPITTHYIAVERCLCCITQPPWLVANAAHGKRWICARVGCLPAPWYDTLDKKRRTPLFSLLPVFRFRIVSRLVIATFRHHHRAAYNDGAVQGKKNFTCDHTPWHPQLQRLSIFETV